MDDGLEYSDDYGQFENLYHGGMYVCMYVCMYMYVYVCMCMYVCGEGGVVSELLISTKLLQAAYSRE